MIRDELCLGASQGLSGQIVQARMAQATGLPALNPKPAALGWLIACTSLSEPELTGSCFESKLLKCFTVYLEGHTPLRF